MRLEAQPGTSSSNVNDPASCGRPEIVDPALSKDPLVQRAFGLHIWPLPPLV